MKFILLLLLTVFICSCAANSTFDNSKIQITSSKTKGAPDWIDNEESIQGAITAVGIAQPNPLSDKSMQRTEAIADARAKLAQKVSVRVQNIYTQLNKRVTNAGNSSQDGAIAKSDVMSRIIEDTKRQITDVELTGASARQFWTDSNDGNLYVQMVLAKETLDKSLKSAIASSLQKEIAQGTVELNDALSRLDSAIAKK